MKRKERSKVWRENISNGKILENLSACSLKRSRIVRNSDDDLSRAKYLKSERVSGSEWSRVWKGEVN